MRRIWRGVRGAVIALVVLFVGMTAFTLLSELLESGGMDTGSAVTVSALLCLVAAIGFWRGSRRESN